MLGSDGGFARYRIHISPWLWRLDQVRNSRVWQDKSAIDIVDAVFQPYLPLARWRWSADVRLFMAEEGLSWRFEQTEVGVEAVLFADSTQPAAVPEDASSSADGGIRFHSASAVEVRDTVQALRAQRSLHASLVTVLSSDYKAKQSLSGSAPTHVRHGRNLPELESYELPGQYAYGNRDIAGRDADLRMQAREARGQLWQGRSTVRTLCAGMSTTVTGTPLAQLGDAPAFTMLRVVSVGVNNLPPPAPTRWQSCSGRFPSCWRSAPANDRPPIWRWQSSGP